LFVHLGYLSFWRNRQRSGVGVVSIALAAMVFVSGTLLAQGVPGLSYRAEREFMGGDIVIFGLKLPNAFELATPGTYWEFRTLPLTLGTQLDVFLPAAYNEGALMAPGIHRLDRGVLEAIASHPEVEFVYPYQRLPVIVEDEGGQHLSYVRARDHLLDARLGFDKRVTGGRYFVKADAGEPVALVDSFRPSFSGRDDARFGYDRFNEKWVTWVGGKAVVADFAVPRAGETLCVRVPRWRNGPDNTMVPDFATAENLELEVIGTYAVPTRTINWAARSLALDGFRPTQRSDEDYPGHFGSEQLYWATSELLVPLTTFQQLAERALAGSDLPVYQAAAKGSNFAEVNRVVEELRRLFPQLTILTVPQLGTLADMMPEPMFRTPPEDLASIRSTDNPYHVRPVELPTWVREATVLLLYVVGGMILAGNVYVTLLLRRKELGLMLALGARRYQLIVLVLVEVLLIATAGAVLGFAVMTPVVLWQYLSSSVALGTMLASMAKNLGLLLLTTIAASVVFGAFPAWNASRLPVIEVLASE